MGTFIFQFDELVSSRMEIIIKLSTYVLCISELEFMIAFVEIEIKHLLLLHECDHNRQQI